MATNTDEARSSARSRVRILSRRFLVVVGFAAAGWAIGAGAAQAETPDALDEVTGSVTDVTDVLGVSGSEGNTEESEESEETTEVTGSAGNAEPGAESVEDSTRDQAPASDPEDTGVSDVQSDISAVDTAAEAATDALESVSDVASPPASSESEVDAGDHAAENTETDAETVGVNEDSTSDAASSTGPSVVEDVPDRTSRALDAQNAPAEVVQRVDGLLTTVVTPSPTRPPEPDSATETTSSDDGPGSVTSALLRTAGGAVTGVTGTLRGAADTLESSEVLRPVTEIGTGLTEVVRDTTGADTSRIVGGVDTGLREAIDIPVGLVETTYSTRPNVDHAPAPHVVSSPDSAARSADRAGQSQESQKNHVATSAPWSFTPPVLWPHGQQQVDAAPEGSGADGSDRGDRNDAAQGSGSAVTSAGSSPVATAGFLMNRVDLAADTGRRLPSTNGEVPVVADAADDPSFSPD